MGFETLCSAIYSNPTTLASHNSILLSHDPVYGQTSHIKTLDLVQHGSGRKG